jgi:hypothetical protein
VIYLEHQLEHIRRKLNNLDLPVYHSNELLK